jgi:hypothetical protein
MPRRGTWKLLTIPAGFAAGVPAGHYAYQEGKKELKRVKVWRGAGGAMMIVREPKVKQAFDKKMMLCLAATGGDLDKIAASYEAELEKIAFVPSMAGAARYVGGFIGDIGRAGRATATQARQGAELYLDQAKARAADVSRNWRAGLGGRTPQQQMLLDAQAGGARAQQKNLAGQVKMDTPIQQRMEASFNQPKPGPAGAAPATPPTPPTTPTGYKPLDPSQTAGTATAPGAGAADDVVETATKSKKKGKKKKKGKEEEATPEGGWTQSINERYNLNLGGEGGMLGGFKKGPKELSGKNFSKWFGRLDPSRQAEIAALGLGGGLAAGGATGVAGSALLGGGGGGGNQNITVYR